MIDVYWKSNEKHEETRSSCLGTSTYTVDRKIVFYQPQSETHNVFFFLKPEMFIKMIMTRVSAHATAQQ